jgi:hypothetical protein
VTSEEAVLAVTDALADCAVPYVLVGSFATNYYGIPRSFTACVGSAASFFASPSKERKLVPQLFVPQDPPLSTVQINSPTTAIPPTANKMFSIVFSFRAIRTHFISSRSILRASSARAHP